MPNNKPKVLSIEPTPVQVTALLKAQPKTIVKNNVKTKITTPIPTLLTKSDSIYSLTHGWNLGTKIMVIINAKTHLRNETRLKKKPLAKHWNEK